MLTYNSNEYTDKKLMYNVTRDMEQTRATTLHATLQKRL